MAQQVKDLAWSLLWLGREPRLWNFFMPQAWQTNKNQQEEGFYTEAELRPFHGEVDKER